MKATAYEWRTEPCADDRCLSTIDDQSVEGCSSQYKSVAMVEITANNNG
jgi:hypothetical protein